MHESKTLEFKPCYTDFVLKIESLDSEDQVLNEYKISLFFFVHGIIYEQEISLFNGTLFKITINITKDGEVAFAEREKSDEKVLFDDMAKHLRGEITRMREEKLNHKEKVNPEDYEVNPSSIEVKEKIADWKYGEVFLAKKNYFSLIMKTITFEDGFEEDKKKLLLDEVKKLPSIYFYSGLVEFYGYILPTDTHSAALYYYCESESYQHLTLDDLIKNHKYMEDDTKVKLIIRICVGLNQLGDSGLSINRINPANIYIDKNNQCFIGDYEQYFQTKRANLFIPPETNDDKSSNQFNSWQRLVYSFGFILFAIFTGEYPSIEKQIFLLERGQNYQKRSHCLQDA